MGSEGRKNFPIDLEKKGGGRGGGDTTLSSVKDVITLSDIVFYLYSTVG